MTETAIDTALMDQQWTLGPATAEFMAHPEDEASLILQVSLAGLGLELDELQPARLAQALRWLLQLNTDVWATQGWAVGLDEDDELVLLRQVDRAEARADGQPEVWVQEGLARGLELAELWLDLLQAEPGR